MSPTDTILIFLLGAVSAFFSILAGGGITVVLPVLLAMGLSPNAANGSCRLSLVTAGLLATWNFQRKGLIDWRLVWPLMADAALGATLGSLIGTRLHAPKTLLLIVLTSVVSLALICSQPNKWIKDAAVSRQKLRPLDHAVYFGLCFDGGIMAADSAILRLIALVLVTGLSLQLANPIKIVTGIALFSISTAIYGFRGEIDWTVTAWLSTGALLGAFGASQLATIPSARAWMYRLLLVTVLIETIWLVGQYFTSPPAS